MKHRRAARMLALDVLYEAEIKDLLPLDAFAGRDAAGWVVPAAGDSAPPTQGFEVSPSEDAIAYARDLVAGIQAHQADIDALIARYADRWTLQRMPIVDRTVVRIALYEIIWRDDIPLAVAINEAVELAKAMSTEDSGRFVNGLLGRIAERERA